MANMREIRTRIKSIQDTMKITNAMYLISSSKLKRARKNLEKTLPYFNALRNTMADILVHMPEEAEYMYFDNNYKKAEANKKRGYIVVTSDKGLAGSYNHNVIKIVEDELLKEGQNFLFIIGQVGRSHFKRKNIFADIEFLYTAQNPNLYRARSIAETVLELYDKKDIDEVYVVYTKMINSAKTEPEIIKLLPLEKSDFQQRGEEKQYAVFDPSPQQVLRHLVPNYVKGMIYSTLVEAYSSEHNARMTAMEGATKSAKDMIRQLSLMYNRARQAAITQEITEIVSGAKSLSR